VVNVAEKLGQAIKRLQHRHHRAIDAKLLLLGVSLVQWDALRAIHQHPNVSAHYLAQLTFQTDQSFGTLAGRMIARGLIEQTPGPGRALHHHLTSAGEELLNKGYGVVNEVLAESFAPLSPTELDTLYDLLTHLLDSSAETSI
jgi:DNA-binding MarR family transcriptional regulator